MKKSWMLFPAILILLSVFGTFFYFAHSSYFPYFEKYISQFSLKFPLTLPQIDREAVNLSPQATTQKKVSAPPPLRAVQEDSQSFLTSSGIINFTNAQRKQHGLAALKENTKLDASAEIKAKDMLVNQYFAHVSPSGVDVASLAKTVGYEFIEIGENLALGNFADDQILVQAWMDSPGHRANILNAKYQEIGAAVVKGTFEGRSTWFAVQHFGFPMSSCPEPNQTIKTSVDSYQLQLQNTRTDLENLKNEIQSMPTEPRDLYNQKVDEYNNLVSQYNNLIAETKNLVSQYNSQVQIFNQCIGVQ